MNPHINILTFFERFGTSDFSLSYIVMEEASGDLFNLVKDKSQGKDIWVAILPQYARHLIHGIASGVQHLFSLGISHGDIKLENVMIVYEAGHFGPKDYMKMIPKLIDFNNSKMGQPGGKFLICLYSQ